MSWNNDIFSDFLTLIFLAWFFSEMLAVPRSEDVLSNINRILYQELGVGVKKLQTDHKIPQAKVISFQSKKEIPCILEFAGAMESLDKFHSLRLGYIDNLKTGEKLEF
ncbi:hypothetical protein [Bacillus thuringiensis]|uniref:hypothetical protein n=1 Tax=Bacillus thuringiensis TaxID=1428 RepID=UPI003F5B28C9